MIWIVKMNILKIKVKIFKNQNKDNNNHKTIIKKVKMKNLLFLMDIFHSLKLNRKTKIKKNKKRFNNYIFNKKFKKQITYL